jgi:plastocyanin
MRRDVVRAFCALGVTLVLALPATVGAAAAPMVEIKAGSAACGAAAYCISPASLTVPVGATVLWHNLTGAPLLISRCSVATCPGTGPGTGPDAGPPSPNLGTGSEFGQTFPHPGTYNYAFVAGGIAVLSGSLTVTPAGVGAPAGRSVAAAVPAPPPPAAAAVAAPVVDAAGPLGPTLARPVPAPAAAAPAQPVVTPSTGAAPPWGLGLLLAAAGICLLTAARRQRLRLG